MSYLPDEQDELIGDAEAVGGRAFVERLQYLASAETEALCRWDGCGGEPVIRRALWLDAARRLVEERRHTVSGPRRPPVKLVRATHKKVAVVVLLGGVALMAAIGQRMSAEPSPIPATLTQPTVVPLPVQRGVVPLEPEPTVSSNQPKAHAATSNVRARTLAAVQ